jgi:glycosyltransferase involved in cell wall biosynthesis
MRLAYVSTDRGIAYGGAKGAAVHIAEILGALAGEGAEVLLLVSGIAPDAPAPPPGVTVEALPGQRKGASADELLAVDAVLAAWLEERLRRFRAEALYERIALFSSAGSTAARALGIPHLVELNAPLPEEAARFRKLDRAEDAERVERETLAGADLVFPVSSPLAEYASSRGARHVELMPNAVALDRFADLPKPADDPIVAVFSGALRPWHGIETIAEAWRLLSDAAPRLLVVGDGPGRQLMEGIGANVTGAVPHDDVPALLASAHIGLAPYSADAPNYFSPLKLFEYLAAGLAVVAADIPGIRDIVGEDGAAVIPPGDATMLAHAVAALAQSERERARLSRNARSLAEEHTWDRRAQRILESVAELFERQAAPA